MSNNDDRGVRPEISRRIRSIVNGGRNIDDDPPAEESAAEESAAEESAVEESAAEPAPEPAATPEPARAPSPPAQAASSGGDSKALVIGREIVLSGAISACDMLVVDGRVEADLKECHSIIIGDGGVFKGTAEVEEAVIGGLFEGQLTVRAQLVVQGSGRIQGDVRYGQLAVEPGGVIIGNLNTLDG